MAIRTQAQLLAEVDTLLNASSPKVRKAMHLAFEQNLIDTMFSPKRWIGIGSQSSTDAPSFTVLRNDLGGDLIWTRNVQGQYYGTLAGAFAASVVSPQNKIIATKVDGTYFALYAERHSDDVFRIDTQQYENPGINQDDLLDLTMIEIWIFPA